MNNILKRVMLENTPVINKKITDGTAQDVLATIPDYLDTFFKTGLASLSPNIDFVYLGHRRVAPAEEYNTMVIGREGTIPYDLSHNDVYVVEFRFEYEGKLIKRPLYLPYANRGNIMVMGGANYHITPVLSDTVISPSGGGIFIRLIKAKLNFTARSRYFIVNGVKVAGSVVHGEILKPKQITDNIGRPLPATALYLLGKYGLVETLRRYGHAEDVIVTNGDINSYMDYDVYESTGVKPRGLKAVPYIPHGVKILVKGKNMDTAFVENVLYGTIYALDILPESSEDAMRLIGSCDVKTEIAFWRIVLGRIIYKNSFSIERIAQDMDDHFNTLNGYIDALIQTKLAEGGIIVDNFFDLVALLLGKYNNWVLTSKEYNSNVENRYIDILYYITYDIVIGFNRVILSLNKRITKTKNISYKEVAKILTNELSSKKVYGLTKTTEPNLAVASVDYSGDLIYPKVTSILEDRLVLSI